MFLIGATAILSARNDIERIAYVYCPSGADPIAPITVYSSPPMSIPIGSLNCGDKVELLGRKESWVRIASTDAEHYVPITTLSQRKGRFVAVGLSLLAEARPTTGKVLPRAISSPNPEYTQDAQRAGIHGFVILKLTIDKDGNGHDVAVLAGLGHGLDESAEKAVRSWKFEPALQDGLPVDFKGAVQVEFPPRSY